MRPFICFIMTIPPRLQLCRAPSQYLPVCNASKGRQSDMICCIMYGLVDEYQYQLFFRNTRTGACLVMVVKELNHTSCGLTIVLQRNDSHDVGGVLPAQNSEVVQCGGAGLPAGVRGELVAQNEHGRRPVRAHPLQVHRAQHRALNQPSQISSQRYPLST